MHIRQSLRFSVVVASFSSFISIPEDEIMDRVRTSDTDEVSAVWLP